MTIAILAHDSRKELALQFCTAYSGILSRNTVIATGTTGRMLAQATGLPVHCYLSGKLGGIQQISSRVACDEVDLVLFFRDPLKADSGNSSEQNLLRLCDNAQCAHCHQHCYCRGAAARPGPGRPGLPRRDAPGNSGAHFRPLCRVLKSSGFGRLICLCIEGIKTAPQSVPKLCGAVFSITELTVGTACPALWILSGSVLTFPGQPSVSWQRSGCGPWPHRPSGRDSCWQRNCLTYRQ